MTAPAPRPQGERRPPAHDPLLDLLARMIRTAHDRERSERRGRLTVIDGGQERRQGMDITKRVLDGRPAFGRCQYDGCKDPAVNARYLSESWSNRVRISPHGGDRQIAQLCIKHDREFAFAEQVPIE